MKLIILPVTALLMPLAQAAGVTSAELSPILNLGAVGAVLLWFMLRSEPRLVRVEEALNRMTRMLGHTIVSMENVDEAVKRQAKSIVEELDKIDAAKKPTN